MDGGVNLYNFVLMTLSLPIFLGDLNNFISDHIRIEIDSVNCCSWFEYNN